MKMCEKCEYDLFAVSTWIHFNVSGPVHRQMANFMPSKIAIHAILLAKNYSPIG